MDVAKTLGVYQELKKNKTTLDAQYKEAKAPIDAAMTQIEDKLLGHLNETKQDSIKTANGTTFVSELQRVAVEDLEKFHEFVSKNGADFLTKAARKEAVLEYAENNEGAAPPGVTITKQRKINIRK